MRRRPRSPGQEGDGHPDQRALVRPAASVLTLPRLDPAIPVQAEHFDTGGNLVEVALTLAELGVLQECHLRGGKSLSSILAPDTTRPPIQRAIDHALQEWMDRLLAGVRGPNVARWYGCLTHDLEGIGHTLGDPDAPDHAADSRHAAFIFSNDSDEWSLAIWDVGEKLEALEKQAPKAGNWVLRTLIRAYDLTCQSYDPAMAFESCQNGHWMNDESEADRMAEEVDYCRQSGNATITAQEAPERAGLITRAQWDSTMPTWAFLPPLKTEPPAPTRHLPADAAKVLADTRDLAALMNRVRRRWQHRTAARRPALNDVCQMREGTALSAAVLLCWQPDDPCGHFFDEDFNCEYQGGSEVNLFDHTFFAFDAGDRQSIREACQRIEDYALLLHAAGKLLAQIGTQDAR